jgi:hypothetical protein
MIIVIFVALLRTIEFFLSLVSGVWRAIAYKSDPFAGPYFSIVTWAFSLLGWAFLVGFDDPDREWQATLMDLVSAVSPRSEDQLRQTLTLGMVMLSFLGVRIIANWFEPPSDQEGGRPWAGPWEMPIAATVVGLSQKYCCTGAACLLAATYACSLCQSLVASTRRFIIAWERTRPAPVYQSTGFFGRVWVSMVATAIMSTITGMIGFNFYRIGQLAGLLMGTVLAFAGWKVEPPEDIKEDGRAMFSKVKDAIGEKRAEIADQIDEKRGEVAERIGDLKDGAITRAHDLEDKAKDRIQHAKDDVSAKVKKGTADLKRAGGKAVQAAENKAVESAKKAGEVAGRKARQSFWPW